MKILNQKETTILYPNLGRRIKAVLIDSVIFVVLIMTLIPLLAGIEIQNSLLRLIVLISPFFILEPVLVSITGGSIGHHLFQIRVRDADLNQNVNLFLACIRSFVKLFLGGLSLLLILFTKRHQALHDLLSNSIVTFKSSDSLALEEGLKERSIQEAGFIYPSKLKRFILIVVYNVFLFLLLSILNTIFISESCLESDNCSPTEEIALTMLGISWLTGLVGVIYFGIRGRLLGARRKKEKKIFE